MAYPPGTDQDRLTQAALAAGAEEVVRNDDASVEVLVDPRDFSAVEATLRMRGFAPASAEVTERAANSVELSGEAAVLMVRLLEALEGLDEVRDVYSNAEIARDVLEPR
jgi:transcriptional/translational regulatory protein YebC/TACO1